MTHPRNCNSSNRGYKKMGRGFPGIEFWVPLCLFKVHSPFTLSVSLHARCCTHNGLSLRMIPILSCFFCSHWILPEIPFSCPFSKIPQNEIVKLNFITLQILWNNFHRKYYLSFVISFMTFTQLVSPANIDFFVLLSILHLVTSSTMIFCIFVC